MRKLYIISFYIVLNPLNVLHSQVAQNNLRITSIANEGFLLESTTCKILIDALFSDGYETFSTPPKEVIDNIMDSKAPFDGIDLYMLTHYHKDHCDPALINKYLSNYKNIPFVANKPSIVFIDGCCFGFNARKQQFKVLTPENNQSISATVNNIQVKAFGIKHLSLYKNNIDLEENMFNSSYLLDLDGIKVFHSGDIEINGIEEFIKNNHKWTDSINVAFLYYNLLKSGKSDLDYILKTLNPKHIVVMHTPEKKKEEISQKLEELKNSFPGITIFKNTMDTLTINAVK
ncbi:MAG: MBL fold metallo-hydrolase [Paludibacter sp.]